MSSATNQNQRHQPRLNWWQLGSTTTNQQQPQQSPLMNGLQMANRARSAYNTGSNIYGMLTGGTGAAGSLAAASGLGGAGSALAGGVGSGGLSTGILSGTADGLLGGLGGTGASAVGTGAGSVTGATGIFGGASGAGAGAGAAGAGAAGAGAADAAGAAGVAGSDAALGAASAATPFAGAGLTVGLGMLLTELAGTQTPQDVYSGFLNDPKMAFSSDQSTLGHNVYNGMGHFFGNNGQANDAQSVQRGYSSLLSALNDPSAMATAFSNTPYAGDNSPYVKNSIAQLGQWFVNNPDQWNIYRGVDPNQKDWEAYTSSQMTGLGADNSPFPNQMPEGWTLAKQIAGNGAGDR